MGLTLVLLKEKSLLFVLLIGWTLGFWLLIPSDLILHRIFFVTSVMALTAFSIGIRKFNKYIIIVMMTVGLVIVHYLSYLNAVNYNIEFNYIKQSMLVYDKPFSRIHIILGRVDGRGYNNQPTVGDTFNAKTAAYNFKTDTLNLIKAALKDINFPEPWMVYSCEDEQQKCQLPKRYQLLITHTKKDQPVLYSSGMVLIDFNKL